MSQPTAWVGINLGVVSVSEAAESVVRGLGQEETDLLTRHLLDTDVTDVAVARVLRKLDDIEAGAGNLPEEFRPVCKKCDEQMEDGEMVGTAFGNFYHDGCVPSLKTGPMPLGQLLAGSGDTF